MEGNGKERGFGETPVPGELFQGDPLGRTIMEQLNRSPEQLPAEIRSLARVKKEKTLSLIKKRGFLLRNN